MDTQYELFIVLVKQLARHSPFCLELTYWSAESENVQVCVCGWRDGWMHVHRYIYCLPQVSLFISYSNVSPMVQ